MAGLLAHARGAEAQGIASRVAAVRDGHVVMNYETFPDVCGSSTDGYNTRGDNYYWTRDGHYGRDRCEYGPAWLTLTQSHGQTVDLHFRVGRPPAKIAGDVDLGTVTPDDAVDFLIDAAPSMLDDVGEHALAAASVANTDRTGPRLLTLVENDRLHMDLRKNALFWAGQSDMPLPQLESAYPTLDDVELRRHFTFVMSQRKEPEATDKLIDIVRTERDRDVRRQAMFWLGQRKDDKSRQFLLDLLMH